MLVAGSTFGRYRIQRELGAGGMGQVYAAEDTVLRRPVALKIVRLPKGDDSDNGDDDPELGREARARLLREARAAAALRHPNAVAVFDVGETEGVPFIAMELVVGHTLATYVRDPSIRLEQKLGWLLGMARALAAAHTEGIVHRDVKPENVMVQADGSVKVLDFGIAKRTSSAPALAPSSSDGPASFKTAEGVVTGTPRYMSPEQLGGATLDGRTDQFAWAVVAYELLAGVHPQTTTGSAERWGAPPKALGRVKDSIPEALSAIVMRALERWPEHRWPSMDEVVRSLEQLLGVTSTGSAVPSGDRQAAATAPEPTLRLEDTGAPAAVATTIHERPEAAPSGSTGPLPSSFETRVLDVARPTWRRLLVPAVGLGSMFAGLVVMLAVVVVASGGRAEAPGLGVALTRAGWIVVMLAPLAIRAGRPRPARIGIRSEPGKVRIGGAGGMSQSLDAGSIGGTSFAERSVIVLPKRQPARPIVIEVTTEEQAQAILSGLGVVQARAQSGTIVWPLRRGTFDRFRVGVGVTWRTAIVLTYVPNAPLVSTAAFAVAVLAGLGAAGLSMGERSGPRLELAADHLRITGVVTRGAETVDGIVLALRDIAAVETTSSEVVLRLRTGEAIRAAAPSSPIDRSFLTADERTHLAAHVRAAAVRARAAWS